MKKLVLLSAIAMSGLFYTNANAQFSVHLGVNLFPHHILLAPRVQVDEPVYADANYNNDDDYYYLPDVGAYYNINQQCYYYFDGDNWVSAAYLPGEYSDFDWRNARRYEVREARPFLHNDFYVNRYRGNANMVYNRDHFRSGFDDHFNHDAYRGPQRFDDHANYGGRQQFDNNRGDNQYRDNNNQGNYGQNNDMNNWHGNRNVQQPVQNQGNQYRGQGRGNNDGQANQNRNNQPQQRFAQNDRTFGGHNDGRKDRFE